VQLFVLRSVNWGIRRAERLGSERMATVDRVKISDGNRQLEGARGTAWVKQMNRTINWI